MLTVRMIDGMSNVTVDDELSFQTNFLNDEGIVVHSGTDLQVQAQAAPDLSVKVKVGICYVKRDAWTLASGTLKFWEVCNHDDENITIPANNSGGTIRRIICVKIDTGVTSNANGDNVPSLVVVSGVSGGGDPTIPDNHLPLARVIHNNADTSIASGDIIDLRVTTGIDAEKLSVAGQTTNDVLYFDGTKWTRKPAAEIASSDGWNPAGETWTYASPSTFTVSGNQTTKYTKGTRLKFTQTTVKYAVVVASSYSSPNTTVTIAINTDYTIANAAITSPYYSYQANPQGYPTWFNYTPTTGASGSMTWASIANASKFSILGSACTVVIQVSGTIGGTPSPNVSVTLPVATVMSAYSVGGGALYTNGVNCIGATFWLDGTQNTLYFRRYDSGNFTAASDQGVHTTLTYPI